MRVLVVNAGSSSLKLRVLGATDQLELSQDLRTVHGRPDPAALRRALDAAGAVDAVGHRIVHGGTQFRAPVLVDQSVTARLRALTDLAPLHQPKSLAALEAVSAALPGVPAVACFDTAFHAGLPPEATTYALPPEWRRRWNLRRYGFHGLSHAWAARRAAELTGRSASGFRVVTAHLGAGASLAAVRDGCSVDTTMGFTPLEGLVMATRSGSVDPGLVLWLQEHVGTPPEELAATLEHRSGLLGLAGTADMRDVLIAAGERADDGADSSGPTTTVPPADARLALGVYVHRLRGAVAAMAAALGGLDALVFTGGVGENAPEVRRLVADGLAFLGIAVDPGRNAGAGGTGTATAAIRDAAEPGANDLDIGVRGAPVRVFVVESREDLEIARSVRGILDPGRRSDPPLECEPAA
ncbi:MAG: acetate/propionate family kinase [Actinobacteria bacterium]|nr:acetate/propionate family kinase [Actinomycetota bacterium]